MTQSYITKDGDTVDLIAWRVYGAQGGRVVERLLDANQGLAKLGPELPAGITVVLPRIDTKAELGGVRLWD